MPPAQEYDCIVLGAGVLGLSIASELASKGVKLAIIARDLPEDIHSTSFASPWAGANWSSFAVNDRERRRDEITFRRFAKLAEEYPELVKRRPFVTAWTTQGSYDGPSYKDLVFNYRRLPPEQVPKSEKFAAGWESYTVNTPAYLGHLGAKLREAGVPIIRQRVSSLDEAYSLPDLGPVDLVINATGLGSRTLLGVEDPLVHPIRGQTVLVRAPSVQANIGRREGGSDPTYIIPRPGPDGHVILGGTMLKNEWSTLPDPATAERILKDAFKLCPELAEGGAGWEDIEVVSHNVGLRPAREGGLRLELEERRIGQGQSGGKLVPRRGKVGVGRKVACVHAYGIGPAGYQASLGIAEEAAGLVLGYLGRGEAKL